MEEKGRRKNRRSFLKKLGVGGLGASVAPSALFVSPEHLLGPDGPKEAKIQGTITDFHDYNSTYTGKNMDRIAFPVGGMGAGMFALEGNGAISHMSINNKPELFKRPNMFAALSVKGLENGAKVLEGPVPEWKLFGPPRTGLGLRGANYGLPRFANASFKTQFPFAHIALQDDDLPITVDLHAWSPFIPNDEDSSGLPVGALEYTFKNTGASAVEAVFSYNSWNFVKDWETQGGITGIPNGFVLRQDGTEDAPYLESHFAIYTDAKDTVVDHCWFRGNWFDPVTMVWNTIKDGTLRANPPVEDGAPGASFFVPINLQPGEERTVKVMMAWYTPESDVHYGELGDPKNCGTAGDCCSSATVFGVGEDPKIKTYKPWYSSKFDGIGAVVDHWTENYDSLKTKSGLFRDTFYASTLPPEVLEAVAANLTILKSPTVMRQFDGRLWSWEGCGDDSGCCAGSCTHVWNYAQAIPHLFPRMERTLRHTEFCESQSAKGHQTFRANMPISPAKHDFHAAADGQLGGIMKVYREWRISGDGEWLKTIYPLVKISMDFCIGDWDPGHKGIVEEPHHNTYDIEFWGPDGMCCSFYVGALLAMTKMGKFLKEDVSLYKKLYLKGKKYLEEELFDGEYFTQKIQWTGLQAPDPVKASEVSLASSYSEEALELLKKEGPKYQYGKGCLSDGILGGWIARMCALEDPVDSEKIKSHLVAVHQHNLKTDLTDHVNPQRPTYALGHEGGLLLCSWPKGGKLSLPFVYSNEVWTGIEYQVASHLMLMGEVEKGLEIVRICRDRYDGRVRNPFNEYECGGWYARAMASYGLLEGLTGIRYDAVDKTLYIDSKIGNDFSSFLSTATGFGKVGLKKGKPVVEVVQGTIPMEHIVISGKTYKA